MTDQVTDFLTACKSVNKTDAAAVLSQFGSVRAAVAASPDELGLIGGLGEIKVKRLHDAWHKPFSSKTSRERKQKRKEAEAVEAAKKVAEVHVEDQDGDSDEEEQAFELEDMQ